MAHEVGLQAVLGRRGRGEGLWRRKLRAAAQQEDELGAGCWFGQPAAGRQLLGTEDAGCGRRRLLEELLSSALGRRGFGGLVLQREAATGDDATRSGTGAPLLIQIGSRKLWLRELQGHLLDIGFPSNGSDGWIWSLG